MNIYLLRMCAPVLGYPPTGAIFQFPSDTPSALHLWGPDWFLVCFWCFWLDWRNEECLTSHHNYHRQVRCRQSSMSLCCLPMSPMSYPLENWITRNQFLKILEQPLKMVQLKLYDQWRKSYRISNSFSIRLETKSCRILPWTWAKKYDMT